MVTLGTWNLENLFRPGSDGGPDSDQEYQAKLNALAGTITSIAPDVLAVQEVGEPEALADLVGKLDGRWHTELAEPDGRGIRVGFCSRHPLTDLAQVTDFPDQLQPVQTTDDGETVRQMSRPVLRAGVEVDGQHLTLLTCHLKSKLLTYPGGRFTPRDEDERARYAVYALNRRAAEAATVRGHATQLLEGRGQQRAVVVLGDLNGHPWCRDHDAAARAAWFRDRDAWVRPPRPGRRSAAVEPRRPDPSPRAALPDLQRPPGAHRPRPRQPPARRPHRGGHHHRHRGDVDHRPAAAAAQRAGLRPPPGDRPLLNPAHRRSGQPQFRSQR